jgi:NTP pyrophosphatase (non-canonical NTP hydrolase)
MPESAAPGADTPLAVDATELAELIGDLLFEVADLSRRLGIDAEQALRARALAYREQIVEAESGVPNPSWPTD